MSAMVTLTGVSKRYGAVVALNELDLQVWKGEFMTLLGPSGSGKTTLLNLIAGMTSVSTGRIVIGTQDVTEIPPEKRGIGMVFQNYALMPHMTVYENVAFPLQIRRVRRDEIKRRVQSALDIVRLSAMGGRRPRELSGGQQQRVSIARCIVYNPSLILMDEPLGALDKKLREQMQLEIKRIHAELGITMLYVTHDQEEALNMSDRILLMNSGSVEQIGTPNELYSNPLSQFAADFIGQSTMLNAVVCGPASVSLAAAGSDRPYDASIRNGSGVGTIGKLLLRPEALRITSGEAGCIGNNLEGEFVDTLVTGGTVKHFVRCPNGESVTVQEMGTAQFNRFIPGQGVTLSWSPEAGLFLAS